MSGGKNPKQVDINMSSGIDHALHQWKLVYWWYSLPNLTFEPDWHLVVKLYLNCYRRIWVWLMQSCQCTVNCGNRRAVDRTVCSVSWSILGTGLPHIRWGLLFLVRHCLTIAKSLDPHHTAVSEAVWSGFIYTWCLQSIFDAKVSVEFFRKFQSQPLPSAS